MTEKIYLDHNATTPLCEEVKTFVQAYLDHWGNPSSIHWAGRKPKNILREARKSFARTIGCDPLEVIFTSGGSESNNLAIFGTLPHIDPGRTEIITSAIEHPSVFKVMDALQANGYKVHRVPVGRDGSFDFRLFLNALSEKVALVSIMYANNETGHIFPVDKIAAEAKKFGALVHCDAVQALGKSEIDVRKWGVDLASFSGHKFYSLKGAGVLYSKKGTQLSSLIYGGGQERGRRAGTENVLAIGALGAACELASEVAIRSGRVKQLRKKLEDMVLERIEGSSVIGQNQKRLTNTSNFMIDGIDGESLLLNLDLKGFAVSTGAACSSGNPEPSPTLLGMGYTPEEAQRSLRVSLGWKTMESEINAFVDSLVTVVERLRGLRKELFSQQEAKL